jgi:hypothetical protein
MELCKTVGLKNSEFFNYYNIHVGKSKVAASSFIHITCFHHVDDILWNSRPGFELWIDNNNNNNNNEITTFT